MKDVNMFRSQVRIQHVEINPGTNSEDRRDNTQIYKMLSGVLIVRVSYTHLMLPTNRKAAFHGVVVSSLLTTIV